MRAFPTSYDLWIPASVGELVDKITILRIKRTKLDDPQRKRHVSEELEALLTVARDQEVGYPEGALEELGADLEAVNRALWAIEDHLRQLEQQQRFDDAFVQLARAVYHHNDARATLKRRINVVSGSALVEEKVYTDYQTGASDTPIKPLS